MISEKFNRLKLHVHSEKGLKMNIPYNEFVIRCVGVAIILWSFSSNSASNSRYSLVVILLEHKE